MMKKIMKALGTLNDRQREMLGIALANGWAYNEKHDMLLDPSNVYGLTFKPRKNWSTGLLKEDGAGFNIESFKRIHKLFSRCLYPGEIFHVKSIPNNTVIEITIVEPTHYVGGMGKLPKDIVKDDAYIYFAPRGERMEG